jgi:hypothetical protein
MREKTLRGAEMQPTFDKENDKLIMARIEQVRDDFKRIQIVRNEMVRNLKADKPLDYGLITEEVTEVSRRAERLRDHLVPTVPAKPAEDQKPPVEYREDELKGALVELCNLIYGFVENPAFKNPDVTDADNSAKATTDLQNIIEISANVRKSIEKLDKTSK